MSAEDNLTLESLIDSNNDLKLKLHKALLNVISKEETIQKLENEIKELKSSKAKYLKESDTRSTGSQTCHRHILSPISVTNIDMAYNSNPTGHQECSIQTDFSPTIDLNSFEKLNQFRSDFDEPEARFAALEEKYKYINSKTQIHHLEKLQRMLEEDLHKFHLTASLNKKMIGVDPDNKMERPQWLSSLLKSGKFPKRTEICETVRGSMKKSKASHEASSIKNRQGFKNCSSQTEISTLLIGLNFHKVSPEDDLKAKIHKLHGQVVNHAFEKSKIDHRSTRLRQYCDDLNAGKRIKVFESDLSDELKAVFLKTNESRRDKEVQTEIRHDQSINVSEIQDIHRKIFTHLAEKVKQSLQLEIETTHKSLLETGFEIDG